MWRGIQSPFSSRLNALSAFCVRMYSLTMWRSSSPPCTLSGRCFVFILCVVNPRYGSSTSDVARSSFSDSSFGVMLTGCGFVLVLDVLVLADTAGRWWPAESTTIVTM